MARILIKDEAGTTLATIHRPDILDLGAKIRLADGTDRFVLREELRIDPATGTETQTVEIGNLGKPVSATAGRSPRRIPINLGHCGGWTLQKVSATAYTFVRCLDDAEASAIEEAANFCRKYITNPAHGLLRSSYRAWQQAYKTVSEEAHGTPDLADYLQGAFVGWLLVWSLVRDQSKHGTRTGFGKDSDEYTQLIAATNRAYDESLAYRIVEATRNAVTHREMPPLRLHRNRQLDRGTGEIRAEISYTFAASYLLAWDSCPAAIKREFRSNPDTQVSVPDVIDGAMIAMDTVLVEMMKARMPELNRKILYLRSVFSECEPDLPMLIRATRPLAGSRITGGIDFQVQPLHDIAFVTRNAPISG